MAPTALGPAGFRLEERVGRSEEEPRAAGRWAHSWSSVEAAQVEG